MFRTNPCDPLGRAHTYGPLWLHLAALGVTQEHTAGLAIVSIVAFTVTACVLMRPDSTGSLAFALAVMASPAMVFAIERTNVDIIVFLVAAAGASLAARAPAARILGYAALYFAALLKFYPIVAFAALARERRAVAIGGGGAVVALSAALIFSAHDALTAARANIPDAIMGDMFGASVLFDTLKTVAPNWPFLSGTATAFGAPQIKILTYAGFFVTSVVCAVGLSRDGALAFIDDRRVLWFIVGTAILLGCFLAGKSVIYRAIFFVLVLPLTWGGFAKAGFAGTVRLTLFALIIFVLWNDLPRGLLQPAEGPDGQLGRPSAAYFFFIIGREMAWWMLMALLSGALLRLLATSPAVTNPFGRETKASRTTTGR